jgi:ABC-type sugar transport system ATPase subunit
MDHFNEAIGREAVLRAENLFKSYGGVHALDHISLTAYEGLTGIVGDNGAGKSTLMKILSGVTAPDGGNIVLNGKTVRITSPVEARKLGIESLYQDLALADTLSVTSNIFLGRELLKHYWFIKTLDDKAMFAAAQETLAQIKIHIPDAHATVRALSGGQRQAVALARALHFSASVLLLDEPTAALGPKETAAFNEIIMGLVGQVKAIIMVTHNIPQIMAMADRIIVMRGGRIAAVMNPRETNQEELLAFMVGSKEVNNVS